MSVGGASKTADTDETNCEKELVRDSNGFIVRALCRLDFTAKIIFVFD